MHQTPDPGDRPPLWPRGPVPPGTYRASIVGIWLDQWQNLVLALTWALEGGEYDSRRIFDWLPLSGEKEAAGSGKFLAIAGAIGRPAPENPPNPLQLQGRPCLIEVAAVELEDETANEIKAYRPLAGREDESPRLPAVA